ncbi:MAG TPA: hypothetical protein VIK64_09690 [Anaerolineales bacterium]|jgi:hypothetical protein
MRKARSLQVLIVASLIAIFLLTAAAPAPLAVSTAAVQARSELVRLTVENRTSSPIFMRLQGPSLYFLRIEADGSEVFTVTRGEYESTITACGVTKTDTLDMSTPKRVVMPVCGGRAPAAQSAPQKVDLSDIFRIVPVTVINEADTQVLAVLTGAGTYVFLLNKDAERDVTIVKGDYDVKIYACRSVTTIEFSSYKNANLVLRCPQHYTD